MRKVLFLLGQLTDADVEWLISNGLKQVISAGDVLIHQGQPIDSLYVLLDGVLEVTSEQLGDAPIRLNCGEVVGEVSLLDSRPPTATVTASDQVVVLAIPHATLQEKLQQDPAFAARFYHSLAVFLAHRLRNTYALLGFGDQREWDEDLEFSDELSPELLDSVHMAGTRFDRALQRLLAE